MMYDRLGFMLVGCLDVLGVDFELSMARNVSYMLNLYHTMRMVNHHDVEVLFGIRVDGDPVYGMTPSGNPTSRAESMSGNYEPQGYETSSSCVKLYGEVLNNIRVSTDRFREKREDENLLDEELDKHLDDMINQTHAALTLGANDEMEVEDTQILVDEDPSLPSQPPPGKKAKPWSRDKIGGGRKRKVTIPPRTAQQQTEGQQNKDQAHSSRGSRIQVETHLEDAGGPETQFDLGGPETQFGGQSQPQLGVKFLTMGESQSQSQLEAQFGGQWQPQQSSILTYLKRGDRIRQGPNKYTPNAHNKGKGKK
ncbi:OLC1v1036612C1 [Oldenlandia corymbosa var. corymbosa]|uniref:OLC1v1036612C1 n=1 Tax=Oldenlandia corymbosa var. corymbosa TaxID=529605 RepID=A0AAV1CYZ2_OLDCO|nr:OLC1v1036612C1 [Oldenlandia corymbosa var. corymbosa]